MICILFSKNVFVDDEGKIPLFANNLLNGFYSPPYPDINLWNGPGYPVLLAPFLFLKFPFLALRLLNPFLLYFSLIFSYKTLSIYSSKKSAFLLYDTSWIIFSYFSNASIDNDRIPDLVFNKPCVFLFIKIYKQKTFSWKLTFLSAFSIAYLAMTKVIFGYVILFMLFVSIFMFLLPVFRSSAKKSTLIF